MKLRFPKPKGNAPPKPLTPRMIIDRVIWTTSVTQDPHGQLLRKQQDFIMILNFSPPFFLNKNSNNSFHCPLYQK